MQNSGRNYRSLGFNKLLNLIGLSYRAGKCITGSEKCCNAIRTHKTELIIISLDSSANTIEKFKKLCTFYEISYILLECGIDLGKSIGKDNRMVLAVTDRNFASKIISEYECIETDKKMISNHGGRING